MSDKENELLERDAMAIIGKSVEIVRRSNESNLMRNSASSGANNFLVNNSRNSAVNVNIQNSSGIQIGNTINLTWAPGSQPPPQPICSAIQQAEEAKVYRKTSTISELMKSTEHLSEQYLDIFAENFGDRYLQLPVLLGVDDLFVQRMHVDYFQSGKSQEVIYQILYHFFQDHQDKATVGWFTRFLWKNDFKKTVYTVNQRLKQRKKIENQNIDEVLDQNDEAIEESYL